MLFLKSFQENALFHYEKNPFLKFFWDKMNFHPSELDSEESLSRVPGVLVNVFKEFEMISVPKDDVVLTLTSSGTNGQKSQQFLSQESLDHVKKLAWSIHESLGLTSDDKFNYLCFTYDPAVAKDLGTAFTDELLTNFTKKENVFYAIQWSEEKQDFFLNEAETLKKFDEFSKSDIPVRILGFPAILFDLILKHKLKLKLPEGSWLQTGGGWKDKADKEIPKKEFRLFIQDSLGIKESHQRDLFGMVEHGIPYVDCEFGELHIPNYSRVFIRSPKDFSVLPFGETGIVHFLCSYNFSYPAPSLQTTDFGYLKKCQCSLGGDVLVITGRAGLNLQKTCALKALEVIK